MAQDNRLVQEFQENTLIFDIGAVGGEPPTGGVSPSGTYGGTVMPYRQNPTGGLSDALAPLSGLATPGETDSVNKHPINRVALFENEIHNIGQGQWHKQNETTGAWDLVVDLNGHKITTAHQHIGLYPVFNQQTNKRYLVTAYLSTEGSSQRWIGAAYNKDDNIVTSGVVSASFGVGGSDLSPSECQLGNNIYFTGSDVDSNIMVLNGLNLDVVNHSVGTVARPVDLCSYSGAVYMAHKDNSVAGVGSSGVITISRVTPVLKPILRLPFEDLSSSFPSNPELGYAVADTATSISRQKCILFVDNNPKTGSVDSPSMWLYYQNSPQTTPSGITQTASAGYGIYGWSVWEIKADGAGGLYVVKQDDTFMERYRAGLAESEIPVGNADQAVISYCDNYPGWFINSPESSFITLRPFGGEPGQTFYQWNFDPTSGPILDGATEGGPAKVSFSQDKLGGGARWSPAATSTTTAQDVNIWDIAYTSGHFVGTNRESWRIHYKLMPSTAYHAGTAGLSVRWYNDKFHAPNKRCILSSPGNSSHGAVTNNQVDGLTMMSGVDYWVDWDYPANNFVPGDRLYLCGLLFDPATSDIASPGL